MIDLVNSLLSVSRIEMGTFAVEPAVADVSGIIKGVLVDATVQIRQKDISVNFSPAPVDVETDAKLLRIVLQNLIVNAAEYTPHNGTISIRIAGDKHGITIEIEDSGVGIPKEAQAHLFTKFFRADNARAVKPDGNGLGLYITKSIMKALGGTITFTSEENKGTIFTVRLPKAITPALRK